MSEEEVRYMIDFAIRPLERHIASLERTVNELKNDVRDLERKVPR